MSAIEVCKWMWMGWAALWIAWSVRTKRAQVRLDWWQTLTYVVPTAAGGWLFFARSSMPSRVGVRWGVIPPIPWVMWLGAAVTLAGFLFAVWARLSLGRNWSGMVTVKHEHQLIRTGPYRFVRHPIYLGILIAMVGTTICRGNLWSFVGVALVWLGLWLKLRFEERFMVETFGAEYESYRRTTGAILPRLL